MPFIKNRSLKVSVVKDEADATPITESLFANIDFHALDKKVQEYAKAVAIGGVAIYAAVVTINTISEIAVNITNPSNR